MYEIKPFEKDHLRRLKVGPETKEMVEFIGFEQMCEGLQANGPAFTAFANGEPFAVAGINMLWTGVGEVWAMFGYGYREHGFYIHKNTILKLREFSADLKLERIQALVLKDHWAGIEWVDRLGFEYEGEMPCYFRGHTYLRYAKIEGVK